MSETRDVRRGPEATFDFHIHTSCSDGSLSAQEVVRAAREAGLEGIAITDHDTVDAYGQLTQEALQGEGGPWIVPGVEISTRLHEGEAHILGYFPGGVSAMVECFVEDVLRRRGRRIREGIVRLRERGLDITWEDCRSLARGRVISLSHVARALVAKRYLVRPHRAYEHLLQDGTVPLPDVGAEEAVAALRKLGAISIWAHPGQKQIESGLEALIQAGIDGVEVYIPRRRAAESRRLAEEVRARGLLVTGGSDSHGGRPGEAPGRFRVRETTVFEFLERLGRRWTASA